jgi:hypothetical protein
MNFKLPLFLNQPLLLNLLLKHLLLDSLPLLPLALNCSLVIRVIPVFEGVDRFREYLEIEFLAARV